MNHLSGVLIVLGVMTALIEAWPWSLIPIVVGVLLWRRARRPQDGGG